MVKRRMKWLTVIPGLLLACDLDAADWPTYRHDNQRSAITGESLALPLKHGWVYRSPNRPAPAWGGPARADFYTRSQVVLKPRLAFDRAFHVAAVGTSVYFGSSVDDSVYSLDALNGRVRWSFTAEGAVRMAPSVDNGHVYVGSDDGSVYCLLARDGSLRWKYTPAGEGNYLVPSDGKFVSPWAIRSGVIVESGKAYFSGGIFPAEGVHVCSLDSTTGSDQGAGLWNLERRNDVSLQGYILASSSYVYIPAGRSSPYIFSRSKGTLLGQFAPRSTGSRGTFALLAGSRLIVGPAARGGALLEEFDATRPGRDSIASHPGGNSMVVAPRTSYVLADSWLVAIDRSDRSELWLREVSYPYSLILAGDVLFAGGVDEVAAFDAETGETLWTAAVTGRAYGLAVANGVLHVSTDRGTIHTFREPGSFDGEVFVRGDANVDGVLDISDGITVLLHLFVGKSALVCEDHGDADDSGALDVTDAIYMLDYLFQNGEPPAAPFPGAGLDTTNDPYACGDPL